MLGDVVEMLVNMQDHSLVLDGGRGDHQVRNRYRDASAAKVKAEIGGRPPAWIVNTQLN